MALVSGGCPSSLSEVRPLLDSPSSESCSGSDEPPPETHRHIRWKSVEALEMKFDREEVQFSVGGGEEGRPLTLDAHPVLCSSLSTDSGCESEGGAESVYSTVTSCNSDIIRMQLNTDLEEEEEVEEAGPPPAPPPPLPPEAGSGAIARRAPLDPGCLSGAHQPELAAVHGRHQLQVEVAVHSQQEQDEFRARSWSLDPKLHLLLGGEEDTSSIGGAEDLRGSAVELPSPPPLRHARSEPSLTTSSSTASMPICRICHMPAEQSCDLISPCRCAGTMQYIHTTCLMHWIEISSRRSKRPPCCELCQYQYHRHKRFRVGRWLLPNVSKKDKMLHGLFLLMILVMVTCAIATIFCFKQDSAGKRRMAMDEAELTTSEMITLVCGILFFGAFFVAMYAEVKAKYSLYRLVSRFFYLNQQWYIDEYDRTKDEKYRDAHNRRAFAV